MERGLVTFDHADSDDGQAHRLHVGLLLAQTGLAIIAGLCGLILAEALESEDRFLRNGSIIVGVLTMAGFAAILTTHDLMAFDFSG